MDSENKIAETMRSIENILRLFYEDQNSRNSPTLDEDKLGFKRVINNIAEHAVQSQLKTFEEKYFKSPPKMCPNCGKMKKAGRKMVIAVDAARRFAYFGKHPQQPSSVRLVSDSVKDDHSGNQQKSAATVPRYQSGQETVYALERQSKWEDIPYAQEQRLSPRITKKNETRQRISSPKKKKVSPSRQRYSNSSYDVILAPTLMRFEPDIVESYSDSSSCSESRSRSRSTSPARSATSSTGSNSPSRYQRTSSWESTYSTYSASSSGSAAPNTSYNEYSSGNGREPHPRGRTLDHRRRSPDYSCSSSRSTSHSRSPDEVYSHRRNRGSNVHPSNHSTDKVGWFRRIRNKLGDHHHHPSRHNTGVKSSKEDETVHTHHRSVANPVSNGKLHCQSDDQMVRKNNRRQVKNEPKQHGHVRKFFGGVVGHFLGSNKSKPSTAGKRRLERTVTGKGNVVRKKLHWWQKIHRRGSSNVGKSRAKLGMKTKYPKSKGYKHNTKMKKLLFKFQPGCL
ncbi:protein KOKOPELLI-like [Papaver somniferum]|uniref:protein KOKOPELLI-like n=1 Tax=Papaver somniferum TaxID=3469 RepID=UPI000E7060FF|nr:protein KOKOPELLI-like [Papaver somniferum]XP_026427946.1 protein KOKOPELLI-like [Papaver somniferum]XP_026427947.1 protein KOKOPELLI-like [Papaver somniferum]